MSGSFSFSRVLPRAWVFRYSMQTLAMFWQVIYAVNIVKLFSASTLGGGLESSPRLRVELKTLGI